jgi:hypothetical protein
VVQLYAQWFYSDQGDTWLGPCGQVATTTATEYGDNYRWFDCRTGADNSATFSGFYSSNDSNCFAATGWSSGIKVSRLLPCLPAVLFSPRTFAFALFRLFAVLPLSLSPSPKPRTF